MKLIASVETGPLAKDLKSEINKLVLGTLALPLNFPGTNYRRGMQVRLVFCLLPRVLSFLVDEWFLQARRSVVSMLEKLMEERRASPSSQLDMLDSLLRPDDPAKPKLSDEQIIDLILTLIYSGFETVSTTTMMSVKYLHDDPKVLEELRVT